MPVLRCVTSPPRDGAAARSHRSKAAKLRAAWLTFGFGLTLIVGATAQDYPARPIRWIVGFPAGGSSDTIARILSSRMQERLGQTVLVENKPGAGSNIATELVVNSPPDGYTLISITSANAINTTVNKRSLSFDLLKQIAPVAGSALGPSVMVVSPTVPANSVAEFIAYAKANPSKINMASAGVRDHESFGGRIVQGNDGREPRSRTLSWLRPRPHRSGQRPGPGDVRRYGEHIAAHPVGQDFARWPSPRRPSRRRCRTFRPSPRPFPATKP